MHCKREPVALYVSLSVSLWLIFHIGANPPRGRQLERFAPIDILGARYCYVLLLPEE